MSSREIIVYFEKLSKSVSTMYGQNEELTEFLIGYRLI
jgi:hypothetical protein